MAQGTAAAVFGDGKQLDMNGNNPKERRAKNQQTANTKKQQSLG